MSGPVDDYNELHPSALVGPFLDRNEASEFCALALKEDRELTVAERAEFEFQDGDDIAGSRF